MEACIPPRPSFYATTPSSFTPYIIPYTYSSTVIFDDCPLDSDILLFDFIVFDYFCVCGAGSPILSLFSGSGYFYLYRKALLGLPPDGCVQPIIYKK